MFDYDSITKSTENNKIKTKEDFKRESDRENDFSEALAEEGAPGCDFMHVHEDVVKRVENEIPRENDLFDLAELFKIFGDSTRIRILYTLSISEMCVCDLSRVLSMNVSAISHQLRILRQARLVGCRREGKTMFYFLTDDHVNLILKQGYEHISE